MPIDFSKFEAITFDCYGTLIDWERGLLAALRPFAQRCANPPSDDAILSDYAMHESAHEATSDAAPFKPYKAVQRLALRDMSSTLGFEIRSGEEDALSRSIKDWPAFDDTAPAMRRLKSRFKLCVCSNIDRDLFEGSRPKLGVDLDGLVTAEDVRSYKPSPGHFERAPIVLGVDRSRILHIAQSLYHDIRVARALGYTTVWVNRQRGRWGATLPVDPVVKPHLEVPNLEALAGLAT